ncbi:unnamed protein product [Owenia fusiformis]|uniref:Uncharacterized protein n=1 Tax=Owenia fusiformis TaxID=6347 RepID=A0A8J1TUA9_OWEFU|nr:unnamed protein product [Owenia fusiformis]
MASDNNRQKLVPWLEFKINSGEIAGLEWIDKKSMIFRIPWKHGGKHDWSKENGAIFKAWAVQTGKFREGIDTEDFPTWKTRLRCAFTKSKEIQEIKQKNNLDDSMDPYKVYQFVGKVNGGGGKRCHSPEIKPGSNHGLLGPDPQLMDFNHQGAHYIPNIPQTVDCLMKSSSLSSGSSAGGMSGLGSGISLGSGVLNGINVGSGELGPDLQNIPSGDLVKPVVKRATASPTFVGQQGSPASVMADDSNFMDVDQPYPGQAEAFPVPASTSTTAHEYTNPQPIVSPQVQPQNMEQPKDNEFQVRLNFRTNTLAEYRITNEKGCRLFHGDSSLQPAVTEDGNCLPQQLFGPPGAEQLSFPPGEGIIRDRKQLDYTNKLLACMDRGLILECDNSGDIYATRLCRCVVFFSTMFHNNGEATKLVRNERTMIFEKTLFNQQLGKFLTDQSGGTVPDTEIRLAFGQKLAVGEKMDMTMIIATVQHSYSLYLKQLYFNRGQDPSNTLDCRSFYVSENDHVDNFVELIKESLMV